MRTGTALFALGLAGASLVLGARSGFTQSDRAPDPGGMPSAAALLRTNVPSNVPGAPPSRPKVASPVANDPRAAERGMKYFAQFNCVGCHANNGAGGMGPALSNDQWLHGSAPANVFLTIAQGRSKGMPAFGTILPDQVIWDLVAYVESISKDPAGGFGKTTSREPLSPAIQQVPAGKVQSAVPWNMTEPFKSGGKP